MARDLKKYVTRRINETFDEYLESTEVKTEFGRPIIGFASTEHPLFDTFFSRGENDHPKNIFRPGYSAIVAYVPYYVGDTPEEVRNSFFESIHLVMRINAVIKQCLTDVGRLYSGCSNLIDWDKAHHRREWSDHLVAYLAGLGSFGPAGSFVLSKDVIPEGAPYNEPGWAGRVGTILTDGFYADKAPEMSNEELEAEFERIQTACRFLGAEEVQCSEEMIAACPGGAISAAGIDRATCQDYCETINSRTPSPDVCAQCYRYR